MKQCSQCKITKPLSDFQNRQKSKDGKAASCAECRRAYDRAKYASSPTRRENLRMHEKASRQRNLEWIWNYLADHPCIDCGESDPVVLEFDHRGDKVGNICLMTKNFALKKLQEEVSKCDVRCANCHRRKTAKDFNWYRHQVSQIP